MITKDDLKNIGVLLDAKIKPLKEDLSSLNLKVDNLGRDFDNFTIIVKNQFDRVEENIEELKEDISILKIDVSELKTDVNELKTDMKEVKTDLKTLTKIQTNQYHQIDKNTDDIRLLKTKLKLA